MCLKSEKVSYNMASKVTHNANECVKVTNDEVQLQCKVPARPSQLRLKREHYYDVKLPTYKEGQKKYSKFMKAMPCHPEEQ